MADWRPGRLSGHTDYEIHDELYTPDGRCVAVLEAFSGRPERFFCNAVTPAGEHARAAHRTDFAETKDWAERVTGLKPNRPLAPSPAVP